MDTKAAKLLESVGLRQTAPRISIIAAMLGAEAPLTQDQVAEKIGPTAPNKTTIYRTLTCLIEKGLVHEAFLEDRARHYELAHHCGRQCCHPHFTCTRCEQTLCLTDIRAPLVELPDGYTLQRQQIRIEGLCDKCKSIL